MLIIWVFILSSCGLFSIYGSGNIVENRYAYTDFTSIKASYTCDLTVMKGDDFSIVIQCDDNIVPYLETSLSGNILNISLSSGYLFTNIEFEATVVMPELKYLNVSGASSATTTGFENNGDFNLIVSGASDANIDMISTANVNCDVSGASYLNMSSITTNGNVTINCSGASTSDCRDISSNNGNITVSGASTVYSNLAGSLNGSVSGASTLYYLGTPTINSIDISGASRMVRM